MHQEGMSILLIEQNARLALAIADRAYVMEPGRIILEGSWVRAVESEEVKFTQAA